MGTWNQGLECYLQLLSPQPPKSDPAWGGHTDGGVYYCRGVDRLGYYVWLSQGPAVTVTPEQLAQQAIATLKLPDPTVERSPSPRNSDQGVPYTWVHLWTWFWTDPAVWQPISKTASVGAVWATVTVRPTQLVYTAGDGGSAACAGPGRAWTTADGNAAPSGGGCGYQYQHVSGPVTATVSIRWAVSWVGSGGTGGVLPQMTTTAASRLQVEQIQTVNQVPR